MDYCSYHPVAPATFTCSHCHTFNCDHCVDEGERSADPFCFTCAQPVDALGAVNNAVPFWRRLEESFRYPLKSGGAVLILVFSLLTSASIYLPFGFVWYLLLTGTFLKYCFSCLENTALGKLVPPDITEAYGGGLALLANLLVMFIVAGVAVFAAYRYLGPQVAGLLTFFIVIAMPAVIIIYGMTESLFESLNPLRLLRLITGIGMPYGLLLGFLMVMSASVGAISQLLGGEFSFVSGFLQSAVSNYYSVVMFHIMGYMIFQYQGVLGYTAREDDGELPAPRSARERLAAKLQICLKEADYNQVVALFKTALAKFPLDREFNRQYFEFLFATERELVTAASRYLDYLVRSDQHHQLGIIYKRVLQRVPNFRPESVATRHQLAIACLSAGDSRSAARLINGMHKDFPSYPQLPQAYELMAEALENIPNQGEQARKCRAFAGRLAQQNKQPTSSKAESRKATGSNRKAVPPSARGQSDEVDMNKQAGLAPLDFK